LRELMSEATPRWSTVINCSDIERMSEFWCALLGLTPRTDRREFRVLEGKHGLVALQVADDPVTYRHQMHMDIYCSIEDRAQECDRVRSLGARYVRDSTNPRIHSWCSPTRRAMSSACIPPAMNVTRNDRGRLQRGVQ